MQFLPRSDVGTSRPWNVAKNRARVVPTCDRKPKRFRPPSARSTTGQPESEGSDGSARTISVSIHIISSEFQGGGSGSGEAWGETDDVSILAHAPRTAARTGRPVRVQRFITPPKIGKPDCRAMIMLGQRHWLKEFLLEIRLFDGRNQRATLLVRLEPLIGTQFLREVGTHIAQLLVACPLQSLAFAELARFELPAPFQVAGRDLEQLLGLVQLLHERIRLLLATHQFALESLILLRPGWCCDRREYGYEQVPGHGLARTAMHSS